MSKKEQFLFEPKMWLGDASILNMDWDVRGMHIHLMCIATQQDKKGYIKYDENNFCKMFSLTKEDWDKRVKTQILDSWKIYREKTLLGSIDYIYLKGLNETLKKNKLTNIPNEKEPAKQIETSNQTKESIDNNRHTIWTIGVGLLKNQNGTELKARAYLGKLIKTYGEAAVAKSIAQISVRNIQPAEINSYLMGLLRAEGTIAKNNKGKVAL